MKNIFRFVMAVAVLFTASCAKEDISSSIVGGGEVEVTFSANLPELGSRAYGTGEQVNKLRYFVYDGNTLLSELSGEQSISVNAPATVTVALLKGMTYNIVFWADYNSLYSYDSASKSISVDYANVDANDEKRDAFYKYVASFDPATARPEDTNIVLTRPFAQLNTISTDDLADLGKSGVNLTTSTITLDTYSTLNLATGEVDGLATKTLKAANVLDGGLLSMNYLLAPAGGYTTEVALTINNNKSINFGNKFNYVPLKRNYRTNIIGKLLTSGTNFTVEIEAAFNQPDEEVVSVNVSTASELMDAIENAEEGKTTEITLGGNIDLSDLTRANNNLVIDAKNADVVINGNGYTLTYKGSDRAIDVVKEAVGTNLTLKNLTLDCVADYSQRGINYNTNGNLTLDNVTVTGQNVTYAVNLPGNSDNAKVEIKNSNITGVIALNVWGENVEVNAVDSDFTSVDKATHENYAAIKLNNDGTGNVAENSVINIVGGKIIARDENGEPSSAVTNATATGVVNISDTTEVVGEIRTTIAAVYFDGYNEFYGCSTIEEAIETAIKTKASGIRLLSNIELSETIVINGSVKLDGNGKTLISTAGRAINVSGAENATIKNLTIECSGERAINVIQNAKNVTIENVTATAANYTVNVAGSAPNAVVAINNSTLNGLCTVNVAAAGAKVTVDSCTVNCNDNNTTAGEAYAALCLNKDAVGGSIIATNTTVNVAEGSDSMKGRNGAANGTVTINGSTDGVVVMVAAITYPDSNYYYSFETLQAAVEYAKAGDTIQLLRNIELSETLNIEGTVVIDLNGKTVTGTMDKSVGHVIKNEGTLTIKNGTISSTAANGGSAVANYGTLTVENTTLNGASIRENEGWPSYPVNNYGDITLKDTTINGYHGAIACNSKGNTTVENCIINKEYLNTSSHAFYITHAEANVVVNGGTYTHKGMDGSLAYVSAGSITVNGGNFYAENGGYGMAALTNGKIVINGGYFNNPCLNWGGIIEINGSNLK